jgi:hypothetical protein
MHSHGPEPVAQQSERHAQYLAQNTPCDKQCSQSLFANGEFCVVAVSVSYQPPAVSAIWENRPYLGISVAPRLASVLAYAHPRFGRYSSK